MPKYKVHVERKMLLQMLLSYHVIPVREPPALLQHSLLGRVPLLCRVGPQSLSQGVGAWEYLRLDGVSVNLWEW